jgi:hypothetical protein
VRARRHAARIARSPGLLAKPGSRFLAPRQLEEVLKPPRGQGRWQWLPRGGAGGKEVWCPQSYVSAPCVVQP